jgi:hypothetical protein
MTWFSVVLSGSLFKLVQHVAPKFWVVFGVGDLQWHLSRHRPDSSRCL